MSEGGLDDTYLINDTIQCRNPLGMGRWMNYSMPQNFSITIATINWYKANSNVPLLQVPWQCVC